jgi:hypothetical protein
MLDIHIFPTTTPNSVIPGLKFSKLLLLSFIYNVFVTFY